MDYFIGVAGKQEGPLSESEVRQRIATGTLGPSDLCWTAGWPEWRRVREAFPDAFNLTAPPAVPTRPTSPEQSVRGWSGEPTGAAPAPAGVGGTGPATAGSTFPATKTSALAIWSLVLAVLGCFMGIPSIVLGHMARSEIARSEGRLTGGGLALAGLIIGYIELAAFVIFAIFTLWTASQENFYGATAPAAEPEYVSAAYDVSQGNLRQLAQACIIHAHRHGGRLPDTLDEVRDVFGEQFAAIMDLPHTPEIETDGYALVPGLRTSRPLATIIAYETVPRENGMRAVALLNGNVVLMPDGDFAAADVLSR